MGPVWTYSLFYFDKFRSNRPNVLLILIAPENCINIDCSYMLSQDPGSRAYLNTYEILYNQPTNVAVTPRK